MRAIVIPAEWSDPVRDVDVPEGDGGSTLYALQSLVGGHIQALPFPARDDVTTYSHEEGKLIGLPINHRASQVMAPVLFPDDFIVGPLLVMGFDARTGTNLPVPDDVADRLLALPSQERVMFIGDYREGVQLHREDVGFDALLTALFLKADTQREALLRRAFPNFRRELQKRYDAPAGLLPGERDAHLERKADGSLWELPNDEHDEPVLLRTADGQDAPVRDEAAEAGDQ